MEIQQALDSDLSDVIRVERSAFGQNDEAELVEALLGDPTARPWSRCRLHWRWSRSRRGRVLVDL